MSEKLGRREIAGKRQAETGGGEMRKYGPRGEWKEKGENEDKRAMRAEACVRAVIAVIIGGTKVER